MSYRFHAQKRNPAALWVLDDAAPFDEQTGGGKVGTTAPGSSAATTAPPLVAGAAYASVFNTAKRGRFESPVFKPGREYQPFSLEAWALPILSSKNETSQKPINNLLKYGRGESVAFKTNNAANWTAESDSTRVYVGSSSRKFKVVRTGGDPLAVSMYSVGHEYNQVDSPNVTAGVTYTAGFYVYTARTNMRAYITFNVRDSSNVIISGTQLSSPFVPLVANSWTRVEATWTPTATGVLSLGGIVNSVSSADVIPEGTETWVDAAYFYEGNFPNVGYTDGSYPGYAWAGAVGASTSYAKTEVSRVNLIGNPSCAINTNGWQMLSGTRQPAPWDPSKFAFRVVGNATDTPYIFTSGSTRLLEKGTTLTASAMISVPANTKYYFRIHKKAPNLYFENQTYGPPAPAGGFVGRVSHTFTLTEDVAAGNLDVALVVTDATAIANNNGKEYFMGDVLLEISPTVNTYYTGDDPAARWTGTAHASSTEVLISSSPQKVLSHSTSLDGLTIDGTIARFAVNFADGTSAQCSYDTVGIKASHLVGTYNPQQISLYVDGVLRSSANITETQVASGFAANDGYLYCGDTYSSQSVAMNGVAIYGRVPDSAYPANFLAGRAVIGQDKTALQFAGNPVTLSSTTGNAYFNVLMESSADFYAGLPNNVTITGTAVVPYAVNGVSQAGSWSTGVPLDVTDLTNAYGVAVEWSAHNVTTEASLDGDNWVAIKNGELVPLITPGQVVTGQTLEVRFSFAGGVMNDPAFLESVRFIGFSDSNVFTSDVRSVSYTYPAVLREDYEPIEFRDANGISLNGGRLIVGADTSFQPEPKKVIEMWIKPVVGQPSISATGTRYVNGVASTAPLKVGQWSLVHIVLPTPTASGFTVEGNAIVGQFVLYPDLTVTQIGLAYQTYFGAQTVRINDPATGIGMAEHPTLPVSGYMHDWSLDGGNG